MIANGALVDILLRHAPEAGNFPTKIKGFTIARRDVPSAIESCVIKPSVVLTAQGKKRFMVGDMSYTNQAGLSIIIGTGKNVDCVVLDASPQKPYCSCLLEMDTDMVAQILSELPTPDNDKQNILAQTCSLSDPIVQEAFTRLAELLDTPEHIQHLAPLIIREIHYRVMTSPQEKHIRTVQFSATRSGQIAGAITWLENNYKSPLKIEALAKRVNMAVSTFHRNFKLVTSLSPLQFQKKLRLFEAQRLMLTEEMDAETTSYEVGYESPTQFNREYKRMFGNSPKKDIMNILGKAN